MSLISWCFCCSYTRGRRTDIELRSDGILTDKVDCKYGRMDCEAALNQTTAQLIDRYLSLISCVGLANFQLFKDCFDFETCFEFSLLPWQLHTYPVVSEWVNESLFATLWFQTPTTPITLVLTLTLTNTAKLIDRYLSLILDIYFTNISFISTFAQKFYN